MNAATAAHAQSGASSPASGLSRHRQLIKPSWIYTKVYSFRTRYHGTRSHTKVWMPCAHIPMKNLLVHNIFLFPEVLKTSKSQKMPNCINIWGHPSATKRETSRKMLNHGRDTAKRWCIPQLRSSKLPSGATRRGSRILALRVLNQKS